MTCLGRFLNFESFELFNFLVIMKPNLSHLISRQEYEKNRDLSHAIKFFEVCKHMDEFLHCISSKKLTPNWESSLDAFKTSVKSFLRPCKHIGKALD